MRMHALPLVLAVSVVASSRAETIRVPQDQPTIQAGIDAAADGDKVIVSPGVYLGEGNRFLNPYGKAIVVRSRRGPQTCIVDCERQGIGLNLRNDETRATKVIGFTVRNGQWGVGAGMQCVGGASPTIRDCIITENITSHPDVFPDGGGVYCRGGAPKFKRCEITNNTTGEFGDGGGVWFFGTGSPGFIDCLIAGNASDGVGGGFWCSSNTVATFRNCRIIANQAPYAGGGVAASSYSTFFNCVIAENQSGYRGGAGGSGQYINCLIIDNYAERWGGGIFCETWRPVLTNCTVFGNVAGGGGGGLVSNDGRTPVIRNSIFWANVPDQLMRTGQGGVITVSYSDIQDGWPGDGNINLDPLFVVSPSGDFYLSHVRAGQEADSPCRNVGEGSAEELGLRRFTTRTDGRRDRRRVDMGYHYPRAR